jgi:hydroxyethylthiazole kinase
MERISPDSIWLDLQKIRRSNPLIHNITNYVVMDFTANALLAVGASPVMAHAPEELDDIINLSSSLVLNIGTLSKEWIQSMELASLIAKKKGIPCVLDPVGAGASHYRTISSLELIKKARPAVIRGNGSEVLALALNQQGSKGVDSTALPDEAFLAAKTLAKTYSCIVVISGKDDIVTDGYHATVLSNGHHWMTKVTGMGCTSTALIGAFCSINPNSFLASSHAMAVMGISAEKAILKSNGPGSFKANFIDALFGLEFNDIQNLIKVRHHEE